MPYQTRTKHRLRVLFVLPPFLPTPPKGYGGIENVAAALLPALKRAGVDLTVATPSGSTVAATTIHQLTKPLYRILGRPFFEVMPAVETYLAKVMKLAWNPRVDVIHDFTGMTTALNTLAAPLPSENYPPVIHTLHNPIGDNREAYEELLANPRLTYTAISNAEIADTSAKLKRRTTVIYNCVDPAKYQLGKGGGRLLVLGRFCHDKGQDRLIKYCASKRIGLDIAGTVAEMGDAREIEAELTKGDNSPFSQNPAFKLFRSVRPLIDGKLIRFYGNLSGARKQKLLAGARALVIPNRWNEPFGMVAIEAMACGTPVITMGTGALPEIVRDGTTGYLANSFEQLCELIRTDLATKLDRHAIRRHVEVNFSATNLAKRFVALYLRVANAPGALLSNPLLASYPNRAASIPTK